MNSFAANAAIARRFRLEPVHVEALKWIAALAMLIEHAYRYVHGVLPPEVLAFGRIVFPLFAVALAVSCARLQPDAQGRVVVRLLWWFIIAQLVSALARPVMPLNVLGTLALGMMVYRAAIARELAAVVALAALGLLFEFGPLGVLGVGATMHAAGAQSARDRVLAGVSAAGLFCLANLSIAPLASLIVLAGVPLLGIELPRVRHFFYYLYAAQFVAFAGMRVIL